MELTEILGIVGLVISVPTALGVALALMRGAYLKARLEESDKDNIRVRERLKECEEECKELITKVAHLEAEKETLTEAATSRAALKEHQELMMSNHLRVLGAIDEVNENVLEVLSHGN